MPAGKPVGLEMQQSVQNAIDAWHQPELLTRPGLGRPGISSQAVQLAIGPDNRKETGHELGEKLYFKTGIFQVVAKVRGGIAPAMTSGLVEIAPQKLMCGDRQQQLATRAKSVADRAKRRLTVANVLENIEHPDHVELFAKRRVADVGLNQERTASSSSMFKPLPPKLQANQLAVGKRGCQYPEDIPGSAANLQYQVAGR